MQIWDETAAPAQYRSVWQIKDGLGRVLQTQSPAETAGTWILTDTSYDARGLVQNSGLPHASSTATGGSLEAPTWSGIAHTNTSYDALRRVDLVTYADSTTEDYTYSGLRTTIKDRNGHQKIQENDAFGRMIKVEEYTGSSTYTLYATTNYSYDERDLLETVTDAASPAGQTTLIYDSYGRKIEMTDPDLGNWRYRYNAPGDLTAQIDAKRQVINLFYDDLHRPKGKTYTTGPVNPDTYQPPADPGYAGYTVKYYYDAGTNGIGHRTSMTDPSGSTTWVYNVLGQGTNETHNVDSTNYSIGATYDAFGRPRTRSLPSAETLNYSYNAMGALTSLSGTSTYVSQLHYKASGQVTDQLLGNGLLQQFCYDANTLRLTSSRTYPGSVQPCTTANPANARLNLSYTYQNNGNVSQIVDATRGETLNYTYDDLDRLLTVNRPYVYNYNYNTVGNMTQAGAVITPTATAAGYSHTCALTTSGGVKCWGENSNGQLGDGSTTQRNSPMDVSGLTGGVAAITAGYAHACALLTTGGLKCWGRNGNGQLGDNSTTQRTTPVDVSGLTSGVATVSAGGFHTCAVTTAGGAVKCWGNNLNGQLGNGSTTQSNIPVSVTGLTTTGAKVAAGNYHTCTRTTAGGLKCWDLNSDGEVGDGTTTQHTTPVDVSGLTSGASAIDSSNYHTCAFTTTNVLKCWGKNDFYQLSTNSVAYSASPLAVAFTTPASYTYGDTNHKHAATALSSGETYTYDANGNMITRVENGLTYTQAFNIENQLISVTVSGQTTQFIYDGDSNLVKKIKPDNSKTIYVGGVHEVDKTSGGAVTKTTVYYPVAGAMRVNGTLYYNLTDHLGSASVMTDASGNVVGENRYYAYGETRLS